MLGLRLHIALLALWAASGNEPILTPRARPEDLQFSVAVENVAGALVVKASVASKRATPLTVGYGACFSHNVRVRLYRTPERRPPAVWESVPEMCTMQLIVAPISPHGSISPRTLAGEITAPGLANGTYFATATIRLAGPKMKSPELPAGSLVVHR